MSSAYTPTLTQSTDTQHQTFFATVAPSGEHLASQTDSQREDILLLVNESSI
jgi:hypothetical protein